MSRFAGRSRQPSSQGVAEARVDGLDRAVLPWLEARAARLATRSQTANRINPHGTLNFDVADVTKRVQALAAEPQRGRGAGGPRELLILLKGRARG